MPTRRVHDITMTSVAIAILQSTLTLNFCEAHLRFKAHFIFLHAAIRDSTCCVQQPHCHNIGSTCKTSHKLPVFLCHSGQVSAHKVYCHLQCMLSPMDRVQYAEAGRLPYILFLSGNSDIVLFRKSLRSVLQRHIIMVVGGVILARGKSLWSQ